MKKRLVCIALAAAMSLSSVTAFGEVKRDETVYVNLKNDGTTESIQLVNRLYGSTTEDSVTDYGSYTSVKSLVDNTLPEVEANKLKWKSSLLQKRDIYYQGTVVKELPFSFSFKYYLDGAEVPAEALAGKNGDVKILMEVGINGKYKQNGLKPSELIVQMQTSINMDKFKSIELENGSGVVVGKKLNATFIALGQGKETFTIKMKGKDIELEPITLSILPSASIFPSGIAKKLQELPKGLTKIENGMSELYDGSGKLSEGLRAANNGMTDIDKAALPLGENSERLKQGSEQVIAAQMQFEQGLNSFAYGMNELYTSHKQLETLAQQLLSSGDPSTRALAGAVLQEGQALKMLIAQESGQTSKIQELQQGFAGVKAGVSSTLNGYNSLNDGYRKVAAGYKEVAMGIGTLISAQGQLSYGILKLRDEGVKTMRLELMDNLSGLMGNGDKNAPVPSFIDDSNKNNSSLQIILKTPGVKKPEIVKRVEAVQNKESFWQKFLHLFVK